jgi:hypothetical protein
LLAPAPRAGQSVAWGSAESVPESWTTTPESISALWADVPEALNDARKLRALERALVDFLYRNARLLVRQHRWLDLISEPQEDTEAFLQRCRAAARRAVDAELAAAKEKYKDRFAAQASSPAARAKVQRDWQAVLHKLTAKWEQRDREIAELTLRPRKNQVRVLGCGVAWAPFWRVETEQGTTRLLAAYQRQPILGHPAR